MTSPRSTTRFTGVQRPAQRVQWTTGCVADAIERSYRGRLLGFIEGEESEAVQLFSTESRAGATAGDWYGEHVGKWLVAATLAHRRTEDDALRMRIARVLAYLVAQQEEDGYLGTYARDARCRMTHPDAPGTRSWDPWVHAWMIRGLLAGSKELDDRRALDAASRIGGLLSALFADRPGALLRIGNHQGLSSAVVIEPLALLTLETGDPSYASLAEGIVAAMEDVGLPILSGADQGLDISSVGTGKAYQLCWILAGLVALTRATGDRTYLDAAAAWWRNISDGHLTPMGGPWGGIGTHKEVFNVGGFFSPEGLTETCSTASWMALSRGLFEMTGDVRYVEACERSLNNALLGAMDENGSDWCYFTFPNGRRNNTYYWACCKSSGALALEEIAQLAVTSNEQGVVVNLLEPCRARVVREGCEIGIVLEQRRSSPWRIEVALDPELPLEFELAIRIPEWASNVEAMVVGTDSQLAATDGYLRVRRLWSSGDRVILNGEVSLKVTAKTQTVDHHGQEIVRNDYAFVSFGPCVYATSLIDGYKKQETLRLSHLFPESSFRVDEPSKEGELPTIYYVQTARQAIAFRPYFEAGGRHDGGWRTTWFAVSWQ